MICDVLHLHQLFLDYVYLWNFLLGAYALTEGLSHNPPRCVRVLCGLSLGDDHVWLRAGQPWAWLKEGEERSIELLDVEWVILLGLALAVDARRPSHTLSRCLCILALEHKVIT